MDLRSATFSALVLIAVLFALATMVERRGRLLGGHPRWRHLAYTCALGVYCSSWTFYGAVGSAVREGWNYLPIYLAPILLLLFAPRFLRQLSQAVAEERATSVADFIAARFSHDEIVARLVTLIALLGSVPYVALQLRSIGNAMSIVSARPVSLPTMVTAAILLALFAVLFGARRYEVAGRSEGLVYAIGADSLFKLLAISAVALLAVGIISGMPADRLHQSYHSLASRFEPGQISIETAVIALISGAAILALPRQFHMAFVEAREPQDLVRARFGLARYVGLMAVLVLPISLAGIGMLGPAARPDDFVLQIPQAQHIDLVLTLAFLGGVSAAASMAIVDVTALATMVSNHLIFPALLRGDVRPAGSVGARMLLVRRLSMLTIMLVALAWALLVPATRSLASIGLIAFAAMVQFTPHLLLATGGGGREPLAARVSLAAGLALWLYTLALPPILPAGWLATVSGGPLDPLRLFGIGNASPLVHGVAWSLGVNLATLSALSARGLRSPPFVRHRETRHVLNDLPGLIDLTASFIGRERAEREFPVAHKAQPIDRASARRAQGLIAQVVGASSARTLVTSALAGGTMSVSEVTRLLDQGGQSLRFSRQLLASTFENVDAGISVVDAELNLVAWNTRYLDLFNYPPGLVKVGVPVAELIRHNAARGDFGPGDVEFHVAKRLGHLRRGLVHSFERHRQDGRVIKTVGGPMPGGGYVMSFTDISEEARVRKELRRTLESLEARVVERTQELHDANRMLAGANRDKTRFLAAASHDLLQPLHAARLFAGALEREVQGQSLDLVRRVESAIVAAEELLRALLDISKLDAGGVQPTPEDVALGPFLAGLAAGIHPIAEAKGLKLRTGPLFGTVRTDPGLLRSVIQNFLANAVRYTPAGGVLIGVRRRSGMVRIDVIDTGIGIPEGQEDAIFREFTRLGEIEAEGFGLGLALVDRIARLLGGRVEVSSHPGRGSRFSLWLEASADSVLPETRPPPARIDGATRALRVLVVDNDPRIIEASLALLRGMGHEVFGISGPREAPETLDGIDVVLADYHLDDGDNGLDLIASLRRRKPALPAALITAEGSTDLLRRAAALDVPVFAKPASPAQIAAFLAGVTV